MTTIREASLYEQSSGRWTFTIPKDIKEQMIADGFQLGTVFIAYDKETGPRIIRPSRIIVASSQIGAPSMKRESRAIGAAAYAAKKKDDMPRAYFDEAIRPLSDDKEPEVLEILYI